MALVSEHTAATCTIISQSFAEVTRWSPFMSKFGRYSLAQDVSVNPKGGRWEVLVPSTCLSLTEHTGSGEKEADSTISQKV